MRSRIVPGVVPAANLPAPCSVLSGPCRAMMCCIVLAETRASNGSSRDGSACAANCGAGSAKRRPSSAAATNRVAVRLAPAEQPLDIGEAEFDIGRSSVVALTAMRGCLHLAQQRVHLGVVEAA